MLDPNGAVVGAKPRHMRLFGARTAAWYLKAVLTFTDAMWLYAARSGTSIFFHVSTHCIWNRIENVRAQVLR
jgi:hypothetical protein